MTALSDGFSTGTNVRPLQAPLQDAWRKIARQRLSRALAAAAPLPFDDHSRFIFFSDLHRGNDGPTDAFAKNKLLFKAALRHYFEEDYTYIEVGDGDELWFNGQFSDVLVAQRDVFDILHAFDEQQRLHLLVGNHDTFNNLNHQREKDGIPTRHSLLLQHSVSGQTLFVTHGHQADLTSSHFYALTRLICRSVWQPFEKMRLEREMADAIAPRPTEQQRERTYPFAGQGRRIQSLLREWTAETRQPMICGHTHLPALPGRYKPPYFNTGSGVAPGIITGLELENGELRLVKWSPGDRGKAQREMLARPRLLSELPEATLADR